jgi:hypothetical protein
MKLRLNLRQQTCAIVRGRIRGFLDELRSQILRSAFSILKGIAE